MTSEKTIEKSKLIKLLSSFSALEWKRFGRFVQSPYHNTNKQLIYLYTILKKAFPFKKLKDLEQERLYKKVYGGEVFKLSKFQNLCSDFYELTTDFMLDMHLTKEKRKKKKLVVDMLSERNYDLFKGASQQLIKEVETQDYLLDNDDFLLLYQLYDGLYHHVESDKYKISQTNFDKSVANLDNFYEDLTVQLSAENSGNRNFLNRKKRINQVKAFKLKDLFQLAIELHQHKKTDIYFQLKSTVFDNWDKLKIGHKTNLFIHLLNFSFTNNLMQKDSGYQESFELYKIGIRDKLFIINGTMREIDFINIAMLGFGLAENVWTENFIKDNQQYLNKEARYFVVPLTMAYKANVEKDYKRVIELLSELVPTNQLRDLSKIKSLLVRAYFDGLINGEEHYRYALDYEIESFKKMMHRNHKLPPIKTNSYLNFLKLLRKLVNIYDAKPNHVTQIQTFEEDLDNISPLILKNWLTEKLKIFKNTASQRGSI